MQNRATDYAVLRGRAVLPLRPLRRGEAALRGRSTRSTAARTSSATRRGSASSSMSNLQKRRGALARSSPRPRRRTRAPRPTLQMAEEKRGDLTDLVLQNAAFEDAQQVSSRPRRRPPGPAKDALWRKAGRCTRTRSRAAPVARGSAGGRDERGVRYKQVGEFNKAIDLYKLFINDYGSDDSLNRLQKGDDPEKQAKVGPEPEEVRGAHQVPGMAYDALVDDVLRVLQLPARRRDVREDRDERALRRDGARERRARSRWSSTRTSAIGRT